MNKFLLWLRKEVPSVITMKYWMLVSLLFAMVLLAVRIITSGKVAYAFLAWNLFLAYIPLFLSLLPERYPGILKRGWKKTFWIGLWILFLPNSFYILTDLFHLVKMESRRPWFDLTLILSFAWNGILFGIISIRKMEVMVEKTKKPSFSYLIVFAVMWLNAFGIYIGRFLRYNSWDIFSNPFSLFSEVLDMVFNPLEYKYAWAMSFCFAFFMVILYYTVKKVNEAFQK